MIDKERVAVLLFNLGGPETLDDVEPFLVNLFSDPDIMDLPALLQAFLPKLIAKRRAPKSRAYYQAIGGGSPLRLITEDQAKCLKRSLIEKCNDYDFEVAVAMRYAAPRLTDAWKSVYDFKPNRLVLLPLYPQRSTTTTRSSFREFLFYSQKGLNLPSEKIHVISAWPDYPPYIEALAETVRIAVDKLPENHFPVDILFSAHGIPEKRIKRGDPYQNDTETTVNAVSQHLSSFYQGRNLRFHLSYQSRVGPLKWLGPETKKSIVNLSQKYQCTNLVLVPVSFVSDHQETLFEMDITYKDLSKDCRILHFVRAPALNVQKSFIECLTALTIDGLNQCAPNGAPCSCQCGVCTR